MSGMPLAEVFRAMRAVCLEGAPIERAFGAHAAGLERLEIYRRFVQGHLVNILSHVYPMTQKELGSERFAMLRQAFYEVHPPGSWDQNANAGPFPALLRERYAGSVPPHVIELADYEWCSFAVAVSTEVIPRPRGVTAPALNPTLVLRPVHYDFVPWIHAGESGGPGSGTPPEEREQIIALYRHPELDRTHALTATPRALIVLKMLFESAPAERVLAETGLGAEELEAEQRSLAGLGVLVLPADYSPR